MEVDNLISYEVDENAPALHRLETKVEVMVTGINAFFNQYQEDSKEHKEAIKKTNWMYTTLRGNGTKGKLKEFEEQDEKLEDKIDDLSEAIWKRVGRNSVLVPIITGLSTGVLVAFIMLLF